MFVVYNCECMETWNIARKCGVEKVPLQVYCCESELVLCMRILWKGGVTSVINAIVTGGNGMFMVYNNYCESMETWNVAREQICVLHEDLVGTAAVNCADRY